MGLFEKIAVTDLKFRLILGPAAVVFAWSLVAGVRLFGHGSEGSGLIIGALIGLLLAISLGFVVYKRLP